MSSKAHLNQAIASHLMEMKADDKPDKEVLIFENGDFGEDILTYRTLYENSNKIARLFLQNGIGKGDTYAVFMRNHPEFVYAMLAGPVIGRHHGAHRSAQPGGAAPVSAGKLQCQSGHRFRRKSGPLRRSLTRCPLSNRFSWPTGPSTMCRIPGLPGLNETLENDAWDPVDQQIMDVRHPMQIIYTSGTTGDPKGVMIRNNRFGSFNIATRLVWKYKPSDVLYSGLSLTHGNAQAVTLFPSHGHRHKGGSKRPVYKKPHLGHLPQIWMHLFFTSGGHDGRHL